MTEGKIQKIFGTTIVLLVLCVGAIAMVFNWLGANIEHFMAQKYNQEQLRLARHIKAQIIDKFSDASTMLWMEAHNLESEGMGERLTAGRWRGFDKTLGEMTRKEFAPILELDRHFLRFAVTDLQGRPAVYLEKNGKNISTVASGAPQTLARAVFGISAGRMDATEALISKQFEMAMGDEGKQKPDVLDVSVPIMYAGKAAGRVFLSISIEKVEEIISDFDTKTDSYDHRWIFDDKGTLVYCSLVMSQEYHQKEIEAVAGRGEGTYDIIGHREGQRDLISIMPVRLGDNRWNIVAESSFEDVLGIVQSLSRVRLLVVVAMLALVVIGGFALYRIALARLVAEQKAVFAGRLAAEEEKFRMLIELAPDPVFLLDSGLRITDCNSGALNALGKPDRSAFTDAVFPDVIDQPEEYLARVRGLGAGEGSFTSELSTSANGKTLYFENKTAKRVSRDGGKPFYQVYLRNVTYRKEYEFNLRREKANLDRIITSMGVGLAIFTKGVVQEWSNARYGEMFHGFNITGRGERCGFCRERGLEDCAVQRAFTGGEPVKEERKMALRDGEVRYYLVHATPVPDERGGIEHVIEIVDDVTESKNLEMQLLQSEKLASIGELASGVAHELNNPIAGIVGYAEFLMEELKGQEGPLSDATRIHGEALRCSKIINNLLTFARLHKPHKGKLSLADVVNSTTDIIEYEFKVNGVVLEKDFEKDIHPVVGDHFQLQQVFLNILNNAFYYLKDKPGDRRIQLMLRNTPSGVTARIYNNGPRIPDTAVKKLFDPFFTTKDVGKGTGLGLSVSHGIIKAHNGEITAANTADGVVFTIVLPPA